MIQVEGTTVITIVLISSPFTNRAMKTGTVLCLSRLTNGLRELRFQNLRKTKAVLSQQTKIVTFVSQ